MYTIQTFESAGQLQAYLRGGGGLPRGEYVKTLRAGGLYYLITNS